MDFFDEPGEMVARKQKTVFLESEIENPAKDRARKALWFVRKYKSPGNRSAPDDLFIKNGRVFFVEFKATGKKPTEKQYLEHKAMREHGATVYWTDSKTGFEKIMEAEEQFALGYRMPVNWDNGFWLSEKINP